MTRLEVILAIDEKIREEEDSKLDTWLALGVPDGYSREDIEHDIQDTDQCIEWISLGIRLLQGRANSLDTQGQKLQALQELSEWVATLMI